VENELNCEGSEAIYLSRGLTYIEAEEDPEAQAFCRLIGQRKLSIRVGIIADVQTESIDPVGFRERHVVLPVSESVCENDTDHEVRKDQFPIGRTGEGQAARCCGREAHRGCLGRKC
jgi:hypothetical protein